MNAENYYSILGVEETSTQEDIKKAYRKLAKENHPDKGGDEELFKKISAAYDTIGDEYSMIIRERILLVGVILMVLGICSICLQHNLDNRENHQEL